MFNINDDMDRFYIESMENDIYIEKLSMLYEMVDREYALNVNQAELKVYKENGTYDDLEYLVEAAEAEAEVKKQSIFAKMLDAIANAFRTISNAIKNFINKDKANNDQEEIVEISTDTEQKYNEFLHCWKSIQDGFNKIRSGDWSGVISLLKGLAIPSFAVAAGTTVAVQMVKKKRGEVTKMSQMLSSISDKISSGIESVKNFFKKDGDKNSKDNKQSEGQNIFVEKLNAAKKFVQNLLSKIRSFLGDHNPAKKFKLKNDKRPLGAKPDPNAPVMKDNVKERERKNGEEKIYGWKYYQFKNKKELDKVIKPNTDISVWKDGKWQPIKRYQTNMDASLFNQKTMVLNNNTEMKLRVPEYSNDVSESTIIDDSLFDELINEAANESTITESFTDDDIQDLMNFFDVE
jgi:hypothetical protein